MLLTLGAPVGPPAATAQSCEAGGAQVHLRVPDGPELTLSPEQIRAEAPSPATYRFRSVPGATPGEELFAAPLPVRTLVADLLGAAAESVTFVTIEIGAQQSVLEAADLREAGRNGFENGLLPAVFANGCVDVGYVRPLRAGDPSDTNGGDYLQTSSDLRRLELTVHTSGTVLTPTITGPDQVEAGASATFSATVPDGGPGLVYDWSFGDGTHSSLASPTHVWSTPSAQGYAVSLSVSGPDSSTGRSNTLRVVVTGDSATPTPTATPSPTAPTGPAVPGSSTGPTRGPDLSEGTVPQAQPSSRPRPEADRAEGSGVRTGTAVLTLGPSPTPGPPGRDTGRGDGATEPPVRGLLLAGADRATDQAAGPAFTSPAARGTVPAAGGLRVPAWLILVGLLALLLGAGALVEARRTLARPGQDRTSPVGGRA